MSKIKVRTFFEDDTIRQDTIHPTGSVTQTIMSLRDEGVRMALIRMGWMPPNGAKRDASMKYVYAKDNYWYAAMPANNGKPKVYIGGGRGGTFQDAVAARDEWLETNGYPPVE